MHQRWEKGYKGGGGICLSLRPPHPSDGPDAYLYGIYCMSTAYNPIKIIDLRFAHTIVTLKPLVEI